jgi:hypothetical protein
MRRERPLNAKHNPSDRLGAVGLALDYFLGK